MKNDIPTQDKGLTWEFAHPSNQRFTGPIERFYDKGRYKMLLVI